MVPKRRKLIATAAVVALSLLLLSACAPRARIKPAAPRPAVEETTKTPETGGSWWYARFRLNWPPQAEPRWYLDLLIAREVVAPVLKQHRVDIDLWRFHRRANRDNAGHQFSFIFYASPQTAGDIFTALEASDLLAHMRTAGIVEKIVFDDPQKILRPRIGDTSDKKWPASIQNTWPYYIMGVSRMWLNLVDELASARENTRTASTLAEKLQLYENVSTAVTSLWQRQGQHAFLHHLNAIFGYEPLIYWEKRYMRF